MENRSYVKIKGGAKIEGQREEEDWRPSIVDWPLPWARRATARRGGGVVAKWRFCATCKCCTTIVFLYKTAIYTLPSIYYNMSLCNSFSKLQLCYNQLLLNHAVLRIVINYGT